MSTTQKPKAAKHRMRRCSHCGYDDLQTKMKPIKGKNDRGTVGWLHEPIEGCEMASARQNDMRARHAPDRTVTVQQQPHTPARAKAFLDFDEDAFKLADP